MRVTLLRIINQLLDISKIELKQIEMPLKSIAPSEVLETSIPIAQVLANKQQISICYIKKVDTIINANYTQLKQVIINLLGNAVKYGAHGSTVIIEELITNAGLYKLLIKDKGEGVPENQQDKLFTAFERLGQEQSENEGTGIGLFVTKALVVPCTVRLALRVLQGKVVQSGLSSLLVIMNNKPPYSSHHRRIHSAANSDVS